MKAFIYVIAESSSGPCKIGYAKDPIKRLAAIQTGNPRKLGIVHTVRVHHARIIEGRIHSSLSDRAMSGEWFSISVEVAVAAVTKIALPSPTPMHPLMPVPMPLKPHERRLNMNPIARVLRHAHNN